MHKYFRKAKNQVTRKKKKKFSTKKRVHNLYMINSNPINNIYLNAKANIKRNIGAADLHCKTKEEFSKMCQNFQNKVKRER